jgi:predicted small secreted protein
MKTIRFLLLVLVVFTLEGCATARGVGEDIQSVGRAIKRVFD